jgi:cytochrome c-type biogenesis protein CcmH
MIWLSVALMTAAAILAVLWPLGRGRAVGASGSDVAVYRDQLAEIERDRAAGRIGEPEAEAARVEVSRRLLAAADKTSADLAESPSAAPWRRRVAAIAALIALPVGALAVYLALGSPGMPGEPLAARLQAPPDQRSLATLVGQVETHLARNPEDGRGWEVLAPVYLRLGRFDEAVKARRNALRLLGASATREADLGEALVASQNGIVTAEAKTSFDRALALDANDVRSRFFLGLAAEQDGRPAEAASTWRKLVAEAPAGAPWAEFVQQALSRLEGATAGVPPGPSQPGPSQQDMAAAADLTPQQRSEMVRGMVERLSERLKQDGSDVDGWMRLVRAYTVLGERDKARDAASAARRALESEPDKLRRVDELVNALALAR